MTLKIPALFMTAMFALADGANAADTQVSEGFINAPLSAVWRIFTTTEGYESTGVNRADMDLEIGGHIRTPYAEGTPGSGETIDNRILAFDPEHMLALQAVEAPASFPHRAALQGTWTVIYFDAAGENMTRVRIVGLGYTDDPESQALRAFCEKANRATIDRIAKRYWPKCAHCQLESPLSPER
jgi:uncharacterized protein YndB with AHSA1/START domain